MPWGNAPKNLTKIWGCSQELDQDWGNAPKNLTQDWGNAPKN